MIQDDAYARRTYEHSKRELRVIGWIIIALLAWAVVLWV